jgi:hypothetical protein
MQGMGPAAKYFFIATNVEIHLLQRNRENNEHRFTKEAIKKQPRRKGRNTPVDR